MSTHPINTPYQHTLTTRPINTPSQRILSIYPAVSTHPIQLSNTLSPHPILLHPHPPQTTDGVAATTVTPSAIGTRRVVHASPSITFPTRMASVVSTSPGTTINASDLTVAVANAAAAIEPPSNFVSISTSGSPRGQGPGATVESTTTTGN